jgi:hypothetical protein
MSFEWISSWGGWMKKNPNEETTERRHLRRRLMITKHGIHIPKIEALRGDGG